MPRAAELIGLGDDRLGDPASRMGQTKDFQSLPGLNTTLPEPQRGQLANGTTLVQLDLPNAPVVCLDFGAEPVVASKDQRVRPRPLPRAHGVQEVARGGGNSTFASKPWAATATLQRVRRRPLPRFDTARGLRRGLGATLEGAPTPAGRGLRHGAPGGARGAAIEDQPEGWLFSNCSSDCLNHAYGLQSQPASPLGHTPEAWRLSRPALPSRSLLSLRGQSPALELDALLSNSALAGQHQAGCSSRSPPFEPGEERQNCGDSRPRLLMAWPLPSAADQMSVVGGDLITTLLAEGRRSRLVERLREQLRLVESVDLDLNVLESAASSCWAVCNPSSSARFAPRSMPFCCSCRRS